MIAGRYRLEREIGRGGAGVVHLAHDEVLDRPVAVKRIGLLPGTTADDVARAEREGRLAAGVNHAHVVSILDLVKDDDCYWLVMEHVDGRSLAEVVAADGPLPPKRAATIVAQAADALVQAGLVGIVHRDVKPGNIMVEADDHAKLGDFGIARSANDTALTQTGLVTGSPAYLAPEVASGSPATPASDVWSLGATLWHALAGRAPYDVGGNVLGGLYKIVHEDPPRLPADHPLAGTLAVMLDKDPARRWSAREVRDDLRRVAGGEPSRAPAPSGDASTTAVLPSASDTAREPAPAAATPRLSSPPPPPSSPAPPSSTSSVASHPRRRTAPWAAALVVLAVVAGIGIWLWGSGDDASTDARDPDQGASAPTSQESGPASTPSQSPSTSPSTSPTDTAGTDGDGTSDDAGPVTAATMRAFVEDYFAAVTTDPESAFAMLTPDFQAESGGYGRYSGFWSTISSASPRAIAADPASLTTSYTIDYVTTSGRSTTEQGRLQLEQQGDRLLIAGEG